MKTKKTVVTRAVWQSILFAGWLAAASAAAPQAAAEAVLDGKRCPGPSVGIAVLDLERDSMVVFVNGDSIYNPASVTKLITAAVAFERLGAGHRCTTRVSTDSVTARDSLLTLRNLWVTGAGDPGFTAERLWLFVEQLSHAGVRKITGDIVIDDFFFDSITVGPGFDEGPSSRAYVPLISALAVNFNTVSVHQRPAARAGLPLVVSLFPEINGMRLVNGAITAAAGRGRSLETATLPDDRVTRVTVRGSMGLDAPGYYSYRKLWQTWESFGNALVPLLERRGIPFSGSISHRPVPPHAVEILAFESQPLTEPVNAMFKFSSNFAAEMLFKSFSADSLPGSWERSAALTAEWWKKNDLPGSPVIRNGSGMGDNRVSPAQTVALLAHVWNQKRYLPDYLSALSNAGIDGTLKGRFTNSPLAGYVRAKTGTINSLGVSTLAGYLLLPDSPPHAFAVFCGRTGQGQTADWQTQEKVLEAVAAALR